MLARGHREIRAQPVALRRVKHVQKGQGQGENSTQPGDPGTWARPVGWALVIGLSLPKSQVAQGGQEGASSLGQCWTPVQQEDPSRKGGLELGLGDGETPLLNLQA